MMCTVVRKLGEELEPAAYPVNVKFVHRVLVKTDTDVEARADISDRLYEKVQAGDRLRFLDIAAPPSSVSNACLANT